MKCRLKHVAVCCLHRSHPLHLSAFLPARWVWLSARRRGWSLSAPCQSSSWPPVSHPLAPPAGAAGAWCSGGWRSPALHSNLQEEIYFYQTGLSVHNVTIWKKKIKLYWTLQEKWGNWAQKSFIRGKTFVITDSKYELSCSNSEAVNQNVKSDTAGQAAHSLNMLNKLWMETESGELQLVLTESPIRLKIIQREEQVKYLQLLCKDTNTSTFNHNITAAVDRKLD